MKLINGNAIPEIAKIKDGTIDLIFGDIPWYYGEKTEISFVYKDLFKEFSRILKKSGVVCIIVDTGSCLYAFIEYTLSLGEWFKLIKFYCHIEDDRFGNLLILKHNDAFKGKHVQEFICSKRPEGGHPNERETGLFKHIISEYTKSGDLVFDPFMGTGNCIIACRDLKRKFIGIEIEKSYFDVAIEKCPKEY